MWEQRKIQINKICQQQKLMEWLYCGIHIEMNSCCERENKMFHARWLETSNMHDRAKCEFFFSKPLQLHTDFSKQSEEHEIWKSKVDKWKMELFLILNKRRIDVASLNEPLFVFNATRKSNWYTLPANCHASNYCSNLHATPLTELTTFEMERCFFSVSLKF